MGTPDQVSQPPDIQPQADASDLHVAHGRLKVGEALPARMSAEDMCREFGIGKSRFYVLVAAGKFDAFEILPQIGARAWSGKLLTQYFDGQAIRSVQRRAR